MNFVELCQRVREEAGVSGLGPTTVVGQQGQLLKIVNWVRSSWLDIQNKRSDWNFLWKVLTFDTTAGEDAYTTGSTDTRKVQRLTIYNKIKGVVDESELKLISYEDMKSQHKIGTEKQARPESYAIRNDGAIVFGPTPEAVYVVKVDYFRKPQRLATNTEIPLMPEEYHDLIVWGALMKFSAHYESTVQYGDARSQFDGLMSDLEMNQLPQVGIAGPLT